MSKLLLPVVGLALVSGALLTPSADANVLGAPTSIRAMAGSTNTVEPAATAACTHRRVCRPGHGCAWRKVCKHW
jgi:hypothetical protein